MAVIIAVVAVIVAVVAVVWAVRGVSAPPAVESEGEGESASLAQQVAVALDAQLRKVAAEALTDNNEQFLTLATERFNTVTEQTKGLLQPVTSQMKQLGETVAELRKAHDAEKGAVDQMVVQMGSQINQLNHSTVSLAEALRSPTYRGAWGDNQLRNIIEMAGMTRYCDFDEQTSGENREGAAGRPDVRVRLPNGAHLAVDAKTPFDAYWRAQQATEPEEIERELVLHAAALKKHGVEGLETNDMGIYVLNEPKVIKVEEKDGVTSYTMEAKSGIMIRTFTLGWKDGKIVSVEDNGAR